MKILFSVVVLFRFLYYFVMSSSRILPMWIDVWLLSSSLICSLDVLFTMGRPYTNAGGPLEHFYYGWNVYADVDKRYGNTIDEVTCATGRVMVIEIILNLVAFIMGRFNSRHTLLMTFMSTAFVFWKTVWYLTLFVLPPEGSPNFFTEYSSSLRIFLVFWIPNGVWVVVPFFVLCALWNRLALPIQSQQKFHMDKNTEYSTYSRTETMPFSQKEQFSI